MLEAVHRLRRAESDGDSTGTAQAGTHVLSEPIIEELDLPGDDPETMAQTVTRGVLSTLERLRSELTIPLSPNDHAGQAILCWCLYTSTGQTRLAVAREVRRRVRDGDKRRSGWCTEEGMKTTVRTRMWAQGTKGEQRCPVRAAKGLRQLAAAVVEDLEQFRRDTATLWVVPRPTRDSEPPRILRSNDDLQRELHLIVDEAEEVLVCAGSRSRDEEYLARIEEKLRGAPRVIHYRVLYGPPRHQILKDHLLRLLDVRDPNHIEGPGKTIYMGVFQRDELEPERFICANENRALIPLPSVHRISHYDTGLLVCDPELVRGWIGHVQEAYLKSEQIETRKAIRQLQVVEPSGGRKRKGTSDGGA